MTANGGEPIGQIGDGRVQKKIGAVDRLRQRAASPHVVQGVIEKARNAIHERNQVLGCSRYGAPRPPRLV